VRDLYLIRTSENVTFEFELAGVASRCLAWLVDVAVMSALMLLISFGVAATGILLGDIAVAIRFVVVFLIQWGYGVFLEWGWSGQTVGKYLMGLRVVRDAGTRITFLQAVVRNLVRIVDLIPFAYLVGGVSAVIDRHGRRLGDIAAGTVVIRERRSPRPTTVVAEVDRYNSFLGDPNVIHATRRITPPERDAIVGLAMRREQLPLSVRHDLFSKMASHLEGRLGIKRPGIFSEERYVLNLTAAVLDASREPAAGFRIHGNG
jgi:uncharacterized RDD family membrane protein YckC